MIALRGWTFPEIEEGAPTQYNWFVQNLRDFHLGYKTDIGAFTYINAKYGVTIEDFVQIGSRGSIYSVSTIDQKQGPVLLKKNCRIGSHSIVIPGVTIGINAVVGAFSFVNRDDDDAVCGTILNDIEVLPLSQAKEKYPDACVVSGIGVPKMRELTMGKARFAGFRFVTLVHPRTEMSKWVEIGEGSVICAGNILTTNITLGKHVQINLDCTVGHDVVMGDYATLAPGVHVSGCVHIGKRAYIGTGAVIINGTQNKPLVIGDDVIIGAGACVTKSISSGTWGGVPARPLHHIR